LTLSICRFEFDFNVSSETLVSRIRAHVHKAGGSFLGSASDGTFNLSTPVGDFKGYYQISGGTILLEITDKPLFVPCSAIEAKLHDYVNRA
jgi:hypothetical protein